MSETINDRTVFSLLEVTKSIQKTLNERYKSSFWVKTEMNKLNLYSHSGHCYPDLIEKKDGKVIAQIRAHLWKDDYTRIDNNFRQILKEPLKDGIKILFQAKISFDPAYGLALLIMDIDPSYTLGDLEREKQETIKRLKEEGIYHKNKSLTLPLLPQRIAIISVETSKGYADFLKVIESNAWNYKFFCHLFPSLLQGEKAVGSISRQLKRIKEVMHHFDVVAIIRGGGGDVGLSCYNNYQLAKEIALFPLPVITGIGHATNETVIEMISFANAITPTKLAEYLLQKFHNFSVPVREAEKKITEKAKRLLSEEKVKFLSEIKLFRSVSRQILMANRNEAANLTKSFLRHTQFIFRNEADCLRTAQTKIIIQSGHRFKNSLLELNSMEKNVSNMSPENVLKRGYSITFLDGRAVKSISQVKNGDTLHTSLFEGSITSILNQINKKNDNE
ncbi:MAG: exodeoxyribonuclease VII large subunit [Tannerella sp.]|jgi:exodeoxyribonuclease VII large subunit|nr:exodeoxyribonuclease VII large subunit [Tannerella sp.]